MNGEDERGWAEEDIVIPFNQTWEPGDVQVRVSGLELGLDGDSARVDIDLGANKNSADEAALVRICQEGQIGPATGARRHFLAPDQAKISSLEFRVNRDALWRQGNRVKKSVTKA